MRTIAKLTFAALASAASLSACNGTTGDNLIVFTGYARGAPGAADPFVPEDSAYSVQLTQATLHIGALYVNENPSQTGSEGALCEDTSIVAAQLPSWVDVDLLDTTPQRWAGQGNGTSDVGLSYSIWFTTENTASPTGGGIAPGGDVTAPDNPSTQPPTLVLVGTATNTTDPSDTFTFGAVVRIDMANGYAQAPAEAALPGDNPICAFRILGNLAVNLDFSSSNDQDLTLTMDPRPWLNHIALDELPLTSAGTCPGQSAEYQDSQLYTGTDRCIPDSYLSSAGGALYRNIEGAGDFYALTLSTSQ